MNEFTEFGSFLSLSITPAQVFNHLAVALLCGLAIVRIYTWVIRRPTHNRTFALSLVTLALITAVVIMIVGNNLARAFGLVGAMSIIRFRTAVKDIQDIAFIFFSLAAGMAAGVGMYAVALVGTGFIGTVAIGLSRLGNFAQKKREYMLALTYTPDEEDRASYLDLLEALCRRHQLISMRSDEESQQLDLSFYVHLRDEKQGDVLIRRMRELDGVSSANLFFDEEYY